MKRYKFLLAMAGVVALMGAILAPNAIADDWNKKTVVTFSNPVEIPGVHLAGWSVLPAGSYVFKILDSMSDRHIVQIFSSDEKTIYATILAIPNSRLKATDKTVITFSERPAGQPEALRAWFYPGRTSGEEFVYPKAKAMELAKTANTPVLFTAVDLPAEVASPIKSVNEPVVVELKRAPIMAVKPTGEEIQLAEVVTAPPAETTVAASQPAPAAVETQSATPVAQPVVAELPATASPLALVALFGFLALGVAMAMRSAEKSIH